MKNVTNLTKLRRLTKSIAASIIFIVSGIFSSSFTTSNNSDGVKKANRDSTKNAKNSFPTLFSGNTVDPTRSYLSQLNPKALNFVQNYIRENSDELNRMRVWGKPYFDIIDGILAEYGLPAELKYLSVIESSLKTTALSPAGALGPWQIMAVEARRLGLVVNRRVDERKNYYKSTKAAAKFMKELYAEFHNWMLVVAAYNCGAGRVRQAIRKSGSKDFWQLQNFLPAETRGHVKRFIGTHFIFEGSGGLTTMTSTELANLKFAVPPVVILPVLSPEEHGKLLTVEISGKYMSSVICTNVGLNQATFLRYNSNFDKLIAKGESFMLRLPAENMVKFEAKRRQILEESVLLLLK